MTLPKLKDDIGFRQIKLLSGKKVGIKPWRVKEEKELLYSTDGATEEEINIALKVLMKKCMEKSDIFDTLSDNDILDLALYLRKVSKGETLEFSYKCTHCQKQNFSELNLDKDIKKKLFDNKHIVIDDMTFVIKELSQDETSTIRKKFPKDVEFNFEFISNSIVSVTDKGKSYTSFTKKEMSEFIESMNPSQFKNLFNKIDVAQSDITMEKEVKCSICDKAVTVAFSSLYDFFVS